MNRKRTHWLGSMVLLALALSIGCEKKGTPQQSKQGASTAPAKKSEVKSTPERLAKWSKFWSEFQTALKANDRRSLYELSVHRDFYWEEESLDLPHGGESQEGYAFNSFEDFDRVYDKVFNPKIKSHLLSSEPIDTIRAGFFMQWDEQRGSYSIEFSRTPEGEFRFAGLLIGPP